jgi:hypothetical protein
MANAEATGNPGIAAAVAGMLGGTSISPSVSAADIASENAQEISGSLSALGLGGVFSGSSFANAMGATQQGAFGLSGPVGIGASTSPATMASQGVSPSTDVSTSLSSMGISDVSMGGLGLGGITGTGTDA